MKSQQPADRLLRLIKQAIDRSISGEFMLNQFLTWVLQKAESTRTNNTPASPRAFYFTLDFNLDLNLDLDLTLARTLDLDLDLDLNLDLDLARAHTRALARIRVYNVDIDHALARNLTRAQHLDYELSGKLKQMGIKLSSPENWQPFQKWWQVEGQQWREQLRNVMLEYRNIGHDWQFNEQQKQQLQRYYDANHFLVKLMKIEGAVSQEVRADIENSLLLPWDELQRRYPRIYGSHSPLSTP